MANDREIATRIGQHMLQAHRLEHQVMDRPKSRKPARTKRRTGRKGRR